MSMRFTKNFGTILSAAYGGNNNPSVSIPYNILRGPQDWLNSQDIASGVVTDNTEPQETDPDYEFVRTINGNYLPLHTLFTYPTSSQVFSCQWRVAASLMPAMAGILERPTNGMVALASYTTYGLAFGNGSMTPTDAFTAYDISSPIDASALGADQIIPQASISYDSATDTYTRELKYTLYNLSDSDFSFSEIGLFTSIEMDNSSSNNITRLYKDSNGQWFESPSYAAAPYSPYRSPYPVLIAYEALDHAVTLHSGDILQIVLTQGAAGLDWTIRPNTGDAGVEGTVAPPPEKQTTPPTQQEIQTETSDISDATAKAVVELAETYIGNAVYTQALSGTPNRNGAGNGYDCSSFCFYMWQRNGVVCSDNWQSGQNAPNTEALGKWAIKNNKLVSKSQIQVGDIILTARKNSDGTWKYPDKWNHVNHAKLYVGDRVRPDGYHYNVIEMVGTSHDAIRSYYNLDDVIFTCAFIIHP